MGRRDLWPPVGKSFVSDAAKAMIAYQLDAHWHQKNQ